MAVKYVKDFSFPASAGFHGSVQRYAKGGHVTKNPSGRKMDLAPSKPEKGKYEGYAKGGSVGKGPAKFGPGGRVGRLGNPAPGPNPYPSPNPIGTSPTLRKDPLYQMYAQLDKRIADRAMREYMASQAPALGSTVLRGAARFLGPVGAAYTAYDLGKMAYDAYQEATKTRKVAPADQLEDPGYAKGGKVKKVMGEYKAGKLHSGSKKGPLVKDRKQAVAIALSEARKAGAKIPKKAEGGAFDNYAGKTGPYRGSPKKARELGRQDRRAREAMERAEKKAPGLSLDMPDRRSKGGMPRR